MNKLGKQYFLNVQNFGLVCRQQTTELQRDYVGQWDKETERIGTQWIYKGGKNMTKG